MERKGTEKVINKALLFQQLITQFLLLDLFFSYVKLVYFLFNKLKTNLLFKFTKKIEIFLKLKKEKFVLKQRCGRPKKLRFFGKKAPLVRSKKLGFGPKKLRFLERKGIKT